MTNYANKREGFYDTLKTALSVAGGYASAKIVNTYDDVIKSDYELFISVLDDVLLDRSSLEGYGALYELRQINFDIIYRSKLNKTKDIGLASRTAYNIEIEKIEHLLRNIQLSNFKIVVNDNIWNTINIKDIRIEQTAGIDEVLVECIVTGAFIYELSY